MGIALPFGVQIEIICCDVNARRRRIWSAKNTTFIRAAAAAANDTRALPAAATEPAATEPAATTTVLPGYSSC